MRCSTTRSFAKSPSIDVALVDGIIIGNGVNETLGISPRKLFDLVIDVASSVPVGTKIPIELRIPAGDLESLFAVSGPDNPPVFAPTNSLQVRLDTSRLFPTEQLCHARSDQLGRCQ